MNELDPVAVRVQSPLSVGEDGVESDTDTAEHMLAPNKTSDAVPHERRVSDSVGVENEDMYESQSCTKGLDAADSIEHDEKGDIHGHVVDTEMESKDPQQLSIP